MLQVEVGVVEHGAGLDLERFFAPAFSFDERMD